MHARFVLPNRTISGCNLIGPYLADSPEQTRATIMVGDHSPDKERSKRILEPLLDLNTLDSIQLGQL